MSTLIRIFRKNAMIAYAEFRIRFGIYYDRWPLRLVWLVMPASVCNRAAKQYIIIAFVREDPCCRNGRDSSICEAILPAFAAAVAQYDDSPDMGEMDFSQFADELELLYCWALRCRTATAAIEKLNKFAKDLATSRGLARNRDVHMVQAGFQLGLLSSEWAAAGNVMRRPMDHDKVPRTKPRVIANR